MLYGFYVCELYVRKENGKKVEETEGRERGDQDDKVTTDWVVWTLYTGWKESLSKETSSLSVYPYHHTVKK